MTNLYERFNLNPATGAPKRTNLYEKFNLNPATGAPIGADVPDVKQVSISQVLGALRPLGQIIESPVGGLISPLTSPRALQQVGLGVVGGVGRLLAEGIQTNPLLPAYWKNKSARFIQEKTTPPAPTGIISRIQRGIGSLLPVVAAPEALPEDVSLTTARGILPKIARIGTGAAVGGAQSPKHQLSGAIGGALLGGAVETAVPFVKPLSNLFLKKLAQNVERTANEQEGISNKLYASIFRGTKDMRPLISPETQASFLDLKIFFPLELAGYKKLLMPLERTKL